MQIAIVNASESARSALVALLAQRADLQLCWSAIDGAGALAQCAQLRPDVLLLDPAACDASMNGAQLVRAVMQCAPCAILIVTTEVGALASVVYEALAAGALDAVDTPRPGTDGKALLAKIDFVAELRKENAAHTQARAGAGDGNATRGGTTEGAGHSSGNARNEQSKSGGRTRRATGDSAARHLVAIGASAGGPAALAAVLAGLPHDFAEAVVIVQHIDASFTPGMAKWLDEQSALPVRLIENGAVPIAGQVLLAGDNRHVQLGRDLRLGYSDTAHDEIYCPSIDIFFKSVATTWKGSVTGVLLTGMGRDGAAGLKALRERGHHTIAQDSATSAVYGMPKAAAALNAAVDILPLDAIAARLIALCGNGTRVARVATA